MPEESQSLLLNVPPELHLRVFEFLSPVDLVKTARVCREWRDLSNRCGSWRRSYERRFGFSANLSIPAVIEQLKIRLYPRFDGVYSAKCQYYRSINQGQSMTDSRTYLSVVYFRILRFLPEGVGFMTSHAAEFRDGRAQIPRNTLQKILSFSPEKVPRDAGLGDSVHVGRWWTSSGASEDEQAATVTFEYEDKSEVWSAEFLVSHGPRRVNSRLAWRDYQYRRRLFGDTAAEERSSGESVALRLPEEHFPAFAFKQLKTLVYLF